MINCAKCGAFIRDDSSNLGEICDGCKGEQRIRELEAEVKRLKELLSIENPLKDAWVSAKEC